MGGALTLILLVVIFLVTVLLTGFLGIVFGMIAFARREPQKLVITGLSLNLLVLVSLGVLYFFTKVWPSISSDHKKEHDRAQYFSN